MLKNGNHTILSGYSGKPLSICCPHYVLWVFITRKGTQYMPFLFTHPPHHTSTVGKIPCSLKVCKDLIFSASHFSLPSIGYDNQIHQIGQLNSYLFNQWFPKEREKDNMHILLLALKCGFAMPHTGWPQDKLFIFFKPLFFTLKRKKK